MIKKEKRKTAWLQHLFIDRSLMINYVVIKRLRELIAINYDIVRDNRVVNFATIDGARWGSSAWENVAGNVNFRYEIEKNNGRHHNLQSVLEISTKARSLSIICRRTWLRLSIKNVYHKNENKYRKKLKQRS